MKKNVLNLVATALLSMVSLNGMAQVTYFDTNNFLLNYFTNTGSSSYCWYFEPLKTDVERGQLKGQVTKIVSNITDHTGRGFGTHFTDTTYYNAQGNIIKVVALKKTSLIPKTNSVRMSITISIMNRDKSLIGLCSQKQITWMGIT